MSFGGFESLNIGFEATETKRRQKKSFNPDFTGDLDLDFLSRGIPFESSERVGKQTARNILGQRGRIASTPLRVKAEGNLQDAFLTDPTASPQIDPSVRRVKRNGRRKKINKRDKGRRTLTKEAERLRRGGQPRTSKQSGFVSSSDLSFRSVI